MYNLQATSNGTHSGTFVLQKMFLECSFKDSLLVLSHISNHWAFPKDCYGLKKVNRDSLNFTRHTFYVLLSAGIAPSFTQINAVTES